MLNGTPVAVSSIVHYIKPIGKIPRLVKVPQIRYVISKDVIWLGGLFQH